MALSEEIQDAITKHQIFLLRYSAGREKEAENYIDEITEKVLSELEKDELSTLTVAKLKAFLKNLEEFQEKVYSDMEGKILSDVDELSVEEADWSTGLFSKFLDGIEPPSKEDYQLAILAGAIPLAGKTIMSLIRAFKRKKITQTAQTIRDGVTQREPNEIISNRVRSINPLQKKQVGSLIRTINNFTSVQARDVAMRQNIDFFDGYEWIAVLDSRTSLICASRDGTIYPFTNDPKKSPKPPAHFSCRSSISPRLKPGFEGRETKNPRRRARGSGGVTTVQQKTTYQSWLIRQSAQFQDEVLGKTKGRLFRRGKLELDKFVDSSGKTLTLDQLRKMEPDVFNRLKL